MDRLETGPQAFSSLSTCRRAPGYRQVGSRGMVQAKGGSAEEVSCTQVVSPWDYGFKCKMRLEQRVGLLLAGGYQVAEHLATHTCLQALVRQQSWAARHMVLSKASCWWQSAIPGGPQLGPGQHREPEACSSRGASPWLHGVRQRWAAGRRQGGRRCPSPCPPPCRCPWCGPRGTQSACPAPEGVGERCGGGGGWGRLL